MLLAADLERGNAFLHEKQITEFESYAYSITDAGRWKFEAASGNDDEVSAMLLAHWGVVNEGVPDMHLLSAGSFASNEYDHGEDYEDEVVDAVVVGENYTLEPPSVRQLLERGWG